MLYFNVLSDLFERLSPLLPYGINFDQCAAGLVPMVNPPNVHPNACFSANFLIILGFFEFEGAESACNYFILL